MNKNISWKNVVLAIFLAGVSLSCENKVTERIESGKAVGQEQTQPEISYGNLIIKEQSDYLMIPVNATEKNQEKKGSLDLSRYDKRDYVLLYNLIFYHKQTGENHVLLDKRAIINSFDLLEAKNTDKPIIRAWFYQIIDQDTNKDKNLNQEDAVIGYMSDLSGKNLKQVTPNNTRIINWVVLPSQNIILIKILKDSNNDNKFTGVDRTNFVRVSLDNPSIGTEIISEQIEQKVKSYITK
ncbi:hypothetical protein NOS3756_54040 [Nostoc sp. NIES-3756]|jgi:hypothetical protein|uniref:hypothetical protein n=1 Tax=Nostoc sp. NIES-3756 TaxID=1751286 RepID=UPI000721FFEB|nr:hypothetical protein [Nostoc sp. NIES-3756]BAT56399.1 hypothetical protein NOS3756_54040 [Nostoc sp. NIES-3756]BAY35849.1 hypothetical protein NIES2111_01660 [Nostoc sp. NIES-2111]